MEGEDGHVHEGKVVPPLRPALDPCEGELVEELPHGRYLLLLQELEPGHHLHYLPASPLLQRPGPADVVTDYQVPLHHVLRVMVPDGPRVDPYLLAHFR